MKSMKKAWKLAALATAIAGAIALVSCNPPGPGIQGAKGFAKGVITAKGSIWVNGVEYDTTSSSIEVDSATGADSDLQVGMVVSVKGYIDSATGTGTATDIQYAKSIEGIVANVNATAGTFDVFGVPVTTDLSTVWKGVADITGLVNGNQVELSGTASATGIVASLVEVKSSSSEDFNLKGTVSNLSGSTFDLTTEFGVTFTVTITSGTLDAAVVNGAYVEVEFTANASAGTLSTIASKVGVENSLEPEEGDQAEVSGVVTNFVAGVTTTFTVDGQDVSADSSMVAGVADGVEVEVHGTINGTVLVATEVSVNQEADSELEGPVASATPSSGTLVLNGVTVIVDATTIFRDEDWSGHTPVEHFSLTDIAAGDHLQIEAYVSGTTAIAVKVERSDPANLDAQLKGAVGAAADPSITILGAVIDTTGFAFPDGSVTFWAGATPSAMVVVSGTSSGATVTWDSIQLDD